MNDDLRAETDRYRAALERIASVGESVPDWRRMAMWAYGALHPAEQASPEGEDGAAQHPDGQARSYHPSPEPSTDLPIGHPQTNPVHTKR